MSLAIIPKQLAIAYIVAIDSTKSYSELFNRVAVDLIANYLKPCYMLTLIWVTTLVVARSPEVTHDLDTH